MPALPTIREAAEADLPQLVALLAQLAPDVPEREDASSPLPYEYHLVLRQIIETPGQHIFVLEERGKIVGTAALSVIPNVSHRGTPYATIENVVVDAKVRSKGYGELLMHHAIEEARRAGCYKVALTSNKRREDAHRFYERLGFRRTHEAFRLDLDAPEPRT
ncbi:MAG: GNAT family N-acetyltransferase [Chloroflexota bacterium]|nr:GNAT family N-acetyltransferase [Chloroflexota bacterium]